VTLRPAFLVPVAFLTGLLLISWAPSAEPNPAGGKQPSPTLVSLQGAHLPLGQALKSLGEQTAEPVADLMGDPDPTVDVNLEKVPFWDALDALAKSAHGRLDIHSRAGIAITSRPAHWIPPHVSRSGLFRVALNGISSKLDLATDSLTTDSLTCTAAVEVAWEPHLLPLLLDTRPKGLHIQDAHSGWSVTDDSPTSSLAPVDGRTSLSFDVNLPLINRSIRDLALLEGSFYAVAPTKMLTFTFPALDRLRAAAADDPVRQAVQEGVECRVGKVVAEDDHWSVQIVLDYPEGNVKLDSYQSWVVNNDIHLEGKDGDRFPSDAYLLEESTPRHAVLTYHFTDKERMKRGLGEWKLVYTTPALVVKVPVPFSFKDVPLP
jgi:hypothetical protein